MLRTQCAACAKPLAYDAPRCVRCHTRYCDAACQHEHWANGHKKKCKKIARGGKAEQYHADKKFREAAEGAVVACAAQGVPQDAECFICRSSIEGQGIVSGCACHGGMGLAHVACLVRQAEASVKEKEEWNTGQGFLKWESCFDCGQDFHGPVRLALGWAAWKTYVGRPDTDRFRSASMATLGAALCKNERPEEAHPVLEASLALKRRYFSEESILGAQSSLANCLSILGRHDEALVLQRKIYARFVAKLGASDVSTILSGNNLAVSMKKLRLYDEATALLCDQLLPAARQSLGPDSDVTLELNHSLAAALANNPTRTRDDLLKADTIMQGVVQRRRRVFGPTHPSTLRAERALSEIAQFARRA